MTSSIKVPCTFSSVNCKLISCCYQREKTLIELIDTRTNAYFSVKRLLIHYHLFFFLFLLILIFCLWIFSWLVLMLISFLLLVFLVFELVSTPVRLLALHTCQSRDVMNSVCSNATAIPSRPVMHIILVIICMMLVVCCLAPFVTGRYGIDCAYTVFLQIGRCQVIPYLPVSCPAILNFKNVFMVK